MSEHPPKQTPPILRDALHAPWRDHYMRLLSSELQARRDAAKAGHDGAPAGSFLGQYWASPEEDTPNHVIARPEVNGVGGMILLNRYPYANGHLLVALGEGRPRLLEYSAQQRSALWAMVDRAVELVEAALNPQGVNIGVNQGRAAGAGVPMHLHAHVVPRWTGDVNFIDTVGNIRVIPSALDAMAERFRQAWIKLEPQA